MANVTVRLMDKDEDYKKMGTKKVRLKSGKMANVTMTGLAYMNGGILI